ncbi:two-component sensor histidine kinase [Dysgonomonas sp. PH5-45]|uniref:sensor histidine kinase n=1 Tax=unclassified Dysgonomonas TaxID=2630389 RepID=UPI002474F668|nr:MULTISPECIES: histidine kinase [unclassified Dysgonomonas]MDH6354451.1 two-component sensor histidine kinase [Dysgonomonas sp. PH5-45]MDH6387350.1 two-component sensor histidine kinase [Dysgonomonas sp. PH5-37]
MKWKHFVMPLSHILVWGIVLVIPIFIMTRSGEFVARPYISFLVRIGICAVLFYVNYLYLINKYLFAKRFVTYFIINVVLIVLLVGFQSVILNSIFDMKSGPPPMEPYHGGGMKVRPRGPRPPFAMQVISDYLMIIFSIGLSVAMRATVRWYKDSINLEKVKSIQLEADLKNLRSQLNPHFLFNTLNNIYSLIAIDQSKAQESVHRLSSLLRYVLYDEDQQFVPLKKELEFTRNYIDLMKLRIGANVKLNVLIDGNDSDDKIASLLFITLIENAFKHGITVGKDSFIDIKILVEKGKGVICTVENSIREDEPERRIDIEARNSGIGLANMTQRLNLLYPNKHDFVTEKRDNHFFAMLRINFS